MIQLMQVEVQQSFAFAASEFNFKSKLLFGEVDEPRVLLADGMSSKLKHKSISRVKNAMYGRC